MRATALEFRLRMPINLAIVLLGFWAPWVRLFGGRRILLLEWLPLELSRSGMISFSAAAPAVIALGAALAGVGALLRIWGSAWLGPSTVMSQKMVAGAVTAGGPYRYMRNPLYVGMICMVAALGFLMPPSGALVTVLLICFFVVRLTLGEEDFLSQRLGEPYRAYLRATPRYLPRLRSTLPRSSGKPRWLAAIDSELTPIGVFVALAFCSWSYDVMLMHRVILIAFGLSLVVRAALPSANRTAKED